MGLGYICRDSLRSGTKKVNECRACRRDVDPQLEDRDVYLRTQETETESEEQTMARVKNAVKVDMTLHNLSHTFRACNC
jgi:hypothetical protein